MNVLTKNNITLTWPLVYVGVVKNWLSVNSSLQEVNPNEFNKLDQDAVANIYIAADDSKETFLNVLKQIINITDEMFKRGVWVWSIAFLKEVARSSKTVHEKLQEIANFWSLVNYPERWKGFIYYMPISEKEVSSEEKLYKKFTKFLHKEEGKLEEQGYLEVTI